MAFEIIVENSAPLTDIDDLDTVAISFFSQIGYLPQGYDPKTEVSTIKQSIPYKLFLDCFLKSQMKCWTVEELAEYLSTSVPTIYRHLFKLQSMDLLWEHSKKDENSHYPRKLYSLRYYNLPLAWGFVEKNVESCITYLRSAVNHITQRIEKQSILSDRSREKVGEKLIGDKPGDENWIATNDSLTPNFRLRFWNRPIDLSKPLEIVILQFLQAIDYLPFCEDDDKDMVQAQLNGVPYRLFVECLLKRADKRWTSEELAEFLDTTKPTIYRHIKKLLILNLLEKSALESKESHRPPKKAFRLRYGNLAKAWNFLEAYTNNSLRNYRKTVEHLQKMLESSKNEKMVVTLPQ
jgi:predicted transcriptional regulator